MVNFRPHHILPFNTHCPSRTSPPVHT